ncbi:hypothetical protein [Paludibacterium paludis]|uniref:Uncharacterized protein n=1 Tax=Paludibacterium paludis TaxID=1225769 RepID=A0A918NXF1_9NEIS|nr:hypothetical protein [Paludibacterium paludis]GGY03643.1 hypothetical protein GCM10011289_02480 [Paludibacterium paludis]
MQKSQLDYLDKIASDVKNGIEDGVGVLSTGEGLYVALAANRMDLVPGYNIAQALNRLDDGDIEELIKRWKYA